MKVKFLALVFISLFFIFPKLSFAADVKISGKVLDQNNSPVSNSVIVFTTNSGKAIKAATTDISGFYQVQVPQGTYNINVSAPKGAKTQGSALDNTIISTSTNMDFTLKTPTPPKNEKGAGAYFLPIMTGVLLGLFMFGLFTWLILKKRGKKDLPEPSSSN